jgi:hypothetical protein
VHPTELNDVRAEPVFRPGWAIDEMVFSRKLGIRSAYDGYFGGEEARSEYLPERMLEAARRKKADMDRWHAKLAA